MSYEYRAILADQSVTSWTGSVGLRGYAAQANPYAASHLCLERDLAGDPKPFASLFHELHENWRTAGENAVRLKRGILMKKEVVNGSAIIAARSLDGVEGTDADAPEVTGDRELFTISKA